MTDEKPVALYEISEVDGVFMEPGLSGGVHILLCTKGASHEIALKLSAAVVADLEYRLAAVRKSQAEESGLQ